MAQKKYITPRERRHREYQRWLMYREDPLMALRSEPLRQYDKKLHASWEYNEDDVVRQRINEEGCAEVFAAILAMAWEETRDEDNRRS